MSVNIYATTDSDGISSVEQQLYQLIMDYRAENGLGNIPLSKSLTTVAGRHALDTHFNIWDAGLSLPAGANLHSWSDAPYFSDHRAASVMWTAPQRLGTEFPGNGYEISAAGYQTISAALDGWKGSPGHNNVILNKDIWTGIDWSSIGVGVYQPDSYDFSLPNGGFIYHVWFGREADPAGTPEAEGGSDPTPTPSTPSTPTADPLALTAGADSLAFSSGDNLDVTDPAHLSGDAAQGFTYGNTLTFKGAAFAGSHVTFNAATGVLSVDVNRDGTADSSVTLQGSFSSGAFVATKSGGDTVVSYVKYLPSLSDMSAVSSSNINGIASQDFLTGDGSTKFQVALKSSASAAFSNMLGVYEVDGSGNIVDTRILVENTATMSSASVAVDGVESGHKLGFFLLQDGANKIASLASGDTLAFVDAAGGSPNISDGAGLGFTVNGARQDVTVLHSYQASLNADGLTHVLSGASSDGRTMTIGFEDQTGGGDRDFQDVVFDVTPFDTVFT